MCVCVCVCVCVCACLDSRLDTFSISTMRRMLRRPSAPSDRSTVVGFGEKRERPTEDLHSEPPRPTTRRFSGVLSAPHLAIDEAAIQFESRGEEAYFVGSFAALFVPQKQICELVKT